MTQTPAQRHEEVALKIEECSYCDQYGNSFIDTDKAASIIQAHAEAYAAEQNKVLREALQGMLDYSERVREVWNKHQGFGNHLTVDSIPEVNAARAALKASWA